ncbi:S-type pyocin domain-containing protein [Vibrio aerogenes]|uniref:S-type pyocin domain-containing protein n=1 Tax=Vibrio aerogenes TaxID=92172 RepID=UPI0039F039C1
MNKQRPELYQSWEVDSAMQRFSASVSIMASRCFSSASSFSNRASLRFAREAGEMSGKIYRQYQQGSASFETTMNTLSQLEWELRQQADLVTRFGPETITLMMQHHHGSGSFSRASVYRYAHSKEKPQLSHRAEITRWQYAPHARKNLLLRHVAEIYVDELQHSQRRTSGGGSGGGGLSSAAAPQPEASPQPKPAPEARPLTVKEKLAKQRKQNLRESDQAFATVLAREAAEKAAAKQAEAEQTEEQPEEKTVPQIFAKSAQVPAGTCEMGTQCESLSSLGQYGAYAAAIAQGSDELMLSRIAGQALAELPGMAMKIIGRVGILAAFAPTQMSDGTLYSEDDIRQRDMVETNIRLRVDESGQLYGYHVDGDAIPRRTVTQNGNKFEVTLEEGLTIEWIPITGDFGGQPILVNPVPDLETHDIWIHPQAGQGREFDNTYITPIAESELSDYILVFPAETGLKPLYVVYNQTKKPKVRPLEVGTYGDLAPRSVKDGMDIDHIPSFKAIEKWASNGEDLTSEEIKALKNATNGLAIPTEVHRKCSRTYGGRNSDRQSTIDSMDLESAAKKDMSVIRGCLKEHGYSNKDINDAFDRLNKLNRDGGLYE